jgi:hypothetical protein
MAHKIAGTVAVTYQVYDHQQPVFVGKDKMGDDVFRANLVPVGIIKATTSDNAWAQAHKLCTLPVLEIVSHVH